MSVPVQVIGVGRELAPTIDEVRGRLGTVGGVPAVWTLTWKDQPSFREEIVQQIADMLGGRGHEGGFLRVVMATTLAGLANALRALPAPHPALPAPRHLLGIVIAEETALRELGEVSPDDANLVAVREAALAALYVVPTWVEQRRIPTTECHRVAGNILGIVLELARVGEARVALDRWLRDYPGPRLMLAQAARFQAPIVRDVLARRLSGRVTEQMERALAEGRSAPQPVLLPVVPTASVGAALRERAAGIGEEVARRIVGSGELPPEDELARRAAAEARQLPQVVRQVVDAEGRRLRETSDEGRSRIAARVDEALAAQGFAAVAPLVAAFRADRRRIRGSIEALDTESRAAPPPLAEPRFDPPPSDDVRRSAQALETHRRGREGAAALSLAWTLLVSTAAAAAAHPALTQWAGSALPDLPPSAAWLTLPSTVAIVTAGALLLLALPLVAIRNHRYRRREAALAEAAARDREDYGRRWSTLVEEKVRAVARVLESRGLRAADALFAREELRLEAVERTVLALRDQYRGPERFGRDTSSEFETDIELSDRFFDQAETGVDPHQMFAPYDEALRSTSWREQLEFMNPDAVAARARETFRDFAEQIPFAQREQLRAAVAEPVGKALGRMMRHLSEYVPLESQAERFYVVPALLVDHVPQDAPQDGPVLVGVSDLFAVVTRSITP